MRVRHLAEVLFTDITPEALAAAVKKPLAGLKVAPYYGCQLVRPRYGPDDPEAPHSLDALVTALGADAAEFPLKTRCCGSSLIMSESGIAMGLTRRLLDDARNHGAEVIVAVCPLCQTNLDAFQGRIEGKYGTKYRIPVLYLTQLIGLALGIDAGKLGLDSNIVSARPLLEKLAGVGEEVGSGRA